jgi:hypothetical protein
MKIGLVGEAPNDTNAIKNLLGKNYKECEFFDLLTDITGGMLDSPKLFRRLLRFEFEDKRPDVLIFIRDLDSHEKDSKKKRERKKIFAYSNRIVNKTGLFLLNIYELEALILADVEVFNDMYGCEVGAFADPMQVADPKEVLKEASRKAQRPFNESHNPEIFNLLNFNIVKLNCRYFARFIKEFDKRLA